MHYRLRRRTSPPPPLPSRWPQVNLANPSLSDSILHHHHPPPLPPPQKKKIWCIGRIAPLLLPPFGEQIYLCRDGNGGGAQRRLTASQWRCHFWGRRHCGRDNLIGEARRCVPARPHSQHCVSAARPGAGCSPAAALPRPPPPHTHSPPPPSKRSLCGAAGWPRSR